MLGYFIKFTNCFNSIHVNSIHNIYFDQVLAIPFKWPVQQPLSSVTQLCLTLCDPMNRSTPGLPVHHQLPDFTQAHVHQVGDAIQPLHPLSSPSPVFLSSRVFSNESALPSGSQSIGASASASVLPMNIQA